MTITDRTQVLASRIAERRAQLGLSLEAVADAMTAAGVEVGRNAVWKWEQGSSRPTREKLAALAEALEVDEAVLVGWWSAPAGADLRYFEGSSGRKVAASGQYAQMLVDVAAAAGTRGLRPVVLDTRTDHLDASVAVRDEDDDLVAVVIAEPIGSDPGDLEDAVGDAERSAFRVQHQAPGADVVVYFAGDVPDDLEQRVQLLTDTGVTVVVDTDQLRAALATTTGGT